MTMVGKSRICRPSAVKSGRSSSAKIAQGTVPSAMASNVRDILSVASRVAAMPDRDALERYHALTDKRLGDSLTPTERFELERIETRLDATYRDPAIEAQDREIEAERSRILDSIHGLLAKLEL